MLDIWDYLIMGLLLKISPVEMRRNRLIGSGFFLSNTHQLHDMITDNRTPLPASAWRRQQSLPAAASANCNLVSSSLWLYYCGYSCRLW